MDNELNQDFFDLTKNQQEAYLINYMRKLEYIDESKLNPEQKKEIMFGKNEITTQLEKIKKNSKIDKESIITIFEIVKKYSKYIRNEYYL